MVVYFWTTTSNKEDQRHFRCLNSINKRYILFLNMETCPVQLIDDETGIIYSINLPQGEVQQAMRDKSIINTLIARVKDGIIPSTSSQMVVEGQIQNNMQQDEMPDTDMSSTDESTDTWTTQGTLQFITEYENLQSAIDKGKVKQKDAFEKIASNLKEKNIHFTAKQCTTKLASLKRTYKKIKDHNRKSGNDRQTWQYFDRMDNIFSKKPWINPVATCSAGPEVEEVQPETIEEVPASKSKKKRKSSGDKILEELLAEAKKRRENRARHHAEAMERLDKLLDILQNN